MTQYSSNFHVYLYTFLFLEAGLAKKKVETYSVSVQHQCGLFSLNFSSDIEHCVDDKMEDYMTRTLPAPPRMRPQAASSITNPNFKPNPPSLNPPSYYSTYHPASNHHHYPPRPRPQFQPASTSPVKFYRQTNNYYNSYYEENGTASSMTSSASVTMRRPPNSGGCSSAVSVNTCSTSSSRRNAVYIKEVTPEAAAIVSKSKPPLPNDQVPKPPKPPPRSRPKSWTSTLFNAMRNNHRSVTFQCVEEENQRFLAASAASEAKATSEVIIASDPTMPLAAASSTEGQKFYSLPRPPGATAHQGKLGPTRSRTPSPFRSMIKGLVKGVFRA